MAHAWKKFEMQMKEKRNKDNKKTQKKSSAGCVLQREELTVQRSSAEVTGKAQTFSRIGLREFVSFAGYDDHTLKNIKLACQKHFLPRVGKNLVCDVLAGEEGPSCSTVEQIPDLKLVHVRFINVPDEEPEEDTLQLDDDLAVSNFLVPSRKRPAISAPMSPSWSKRAAPSASSASRTFPKSLSVSDMMRLGKVIKKTANVAIEMRSFHMDGLGWSANPVTAEFVIEKQPLEKEAFDKLTGIIVMCCKHLSFSPSNKGHLLFNGITTPVSYSVTLSLSGCTISILQMTVQYLRL